MTDMMPLPLPESSSDLPTFRISQTEAVSDARLKDLARSAFGSKTVKLDEPFVTVRATAGTRRVEWDRSSESFWMADWKYLWNPASIAPDPEGLAEKGLAFLKDNGLLPAEGGDADVQIGAPLVTATQAADLEMKPGSLPVNQRAIDVHVSVPVTVAGADGRRVPLRGRGLKWSVTYGRSGQVIGCLAGSLPNLVRETAAKPLSFEDAAKASAAAVFELMQSAPQPSRGELSYQCVTSSAGERRLKPVWMVEAPVKHGRTYMRLPASTDALTSFGVQADAVPPAGGLKAGMSPMTLWGDRPPRSAGTWSLRDQYDDTPHRDAAGFREELAHVSGWNTSVFYEEANALESQWNANSDQYVEQLDMAYFAGHASSDGLILADGQQLTPNDLIGAQNSFGKRYLRWVIAAACGPHQDELVDGEDTHSALLRWRQAFGGLHGFFGFATTALPVDSLGATFVRRAREGHPFAHAWLRAARECQPFVESTGTLRNHSIWASVLWPTMSTKRSTLLNGLSTPKALAVSPAKAARISAIWAPV